MTRRLLVLLVLACLLLAPIAVKADTGEQNEIERQCMILLLTDYAKYGAVPLLIHSDAYLLCGLTWWISYLPDPWQSAWWRGRYVAALDILADALRRGTA